MPLRRTVDRGDLVDERVEPAPARAGQPRRRPELCAVGSPGAASRSASECWIDFRPSAEESYLTHRKIWVPICTDLFTLAPQCCSGRTFPWSTRGRCCTCTARSAWTGA